jgi:hypothetical protein
VGLFLQNLKLLKFVEILQEIPAFLPKNIL